jgi:hypothetical protein
LRWEHVSVSSRPCANHTTSFIITGRRRAERCFKSNSDESCTTRLSHLMNSGTVSFYPIALVKAKKS